MNNIEHRKITIDFDVWEPFKKQAESDIDTLLSRIKEKHLLESCGNVKLTIQ